MKKLLLSLTAVAALTFAANAQDFGFSQGNIIVEGNIGFTSNNDKNLEEKNNSFNFNPKVGYFLTDKIAAGVDLSVGSTKFEDYAAGSESINKTSDFGVGLFGRYYFLNVGQRFKTYTQLGVRYSSEKGETETAGVTVKNPAVNTIGAGLGLGANYFLTPKIAINVALTNLIGFSSSKADVSGAKASSGFTLDAGNVDNPFQAASFGLTFKF